MADHASVLPDQILYLIIRFAVSIPDLPLSIDSPRIITTLSLKRLIRSKLPPEHASARLRLIYAGRVLADTAPLSLSLKLPPPPPPKANSYNENDKAPGSKGKGKQPIRDDIGDEGGSTFNAHKYYIHCSLGDALSPSDLAAEASAALTSETSLRRKEAQAQSQSKAAPSSDRRGSISHPTSPPTGRRRGSSTTTPAPQGFDRLLTAGFTPQEIASLRTQFLQNLSYTTTPQNMPSATALRALEDAWLDSSANDPSHPSSFSTSDQGITDAGDAGWGAGFGVEDGGLDDMLWGYLTGFMWGLGAVVWGMREEGVWTRRRQVAVVMGLVLNCAFGFLRWSS